jgi:hypothetical protein
MHNAPQHIVRRPGRYRQLIAFLLVLMPVVAASANPKVANDSAASMRLAAQRNCAAISSRVDAVAGGGPLLLRSYDDPEGKEFSSEPALTTAAFSYDNALAVIALVACAKPAQAKRVGEGLLAAVNAENEGKPVRLRNTYRAGAVDRVPLPNGWWNAAQGRWIEDPYQMGSATGNVAWVALALLTLADRNDDPRWRRAAEKLATWAIENTRDAQGVGGFSGGVHGFDVGPQKLAWKSTEHNIDLAALFDRLARSDSSNRWRAQEQAARRFVDAQWDAASGHFLTGTLPDGQTPNRATSGLDAQFWPLLLPRAPREWRRALDSAERVHGVDGGFDFNDDRDGIWSEGTAQASLAYAVVGYDEKAARALLRIAFDADAGGYLFATDRPRITTGLAIGPDSTSADFYYYRRPHLGATAWAAIAALRWNPFTAGPIAQSAKR